MILTPENYYSKEANQHYMSVSQFKDFDNCEAAALAKLNGEYSEGEVDAFTLGSYVHAAVEGTSAFDEFVGNHPEIYCKSGSNKGELRSEFKKADLMIDTVLKDPLCAQMLEGDKETIITAELFGVKWKSKIDVLNIDAGRMTDLKTVKEIRAKYWNNELRRWESFVEHYGYTIQMGVYTELERIHNRRFDRLEPFIVAVSKEEVPDKEIICFDDTTLDTALQKVAEKLPRIISVKEGFDEPKRCGKCKYCRRTKKAQIVHFMDLLEVI
ncbi:PD-(D/E)XK nuclease-like domain-containing protein [Paenibacillus rigui]|nr:PD-(D/E)XK nuclease-like domain-containing protein [Paenibacillus rigui]